MRVRIRGRTSGITEMVRGHADRMVHFTMDRFAGAVEDVSLLLDTSCDSLRGTLFRCRVSVRLVPRGHLSVTHADCEASAAVDGALERAAGAVQRRLQVRLQGYASSDQASR